MSMNAGMGMNGMGMEMGSAFAGGNIDPERIATKIRERVTESVRERVGEVVRERIAGAVREALQRELPRVSAEGMLS
jgi:hypothetical protein